MAEIRRGVILPPSWPIWAGVAAYPLWWALGVAHVVLPMLAVPVAVYLWRHQRSTGKPLRVPPGFGLWLFFLLTVAVSAVALDETAPGTLPPEGNGRYFAYALRLLHYVALTLFMLYVGNTTERTVSRATVTRAIAVLAVGVVALGLLALVMPNFAFTTPYSLVMPSWLGGGGAADASLAQVQDIVSVAGARPSAPFAFTNTWGEVASLTLVWLVVGWIVAGRGLRRSLGALVVAAAIVPVVLSVNRGVWIAVLLAAGYVAVRFAVRGRAGALLALACVAAIVGALMLATPLRAVITERVGNPHSDEVRAWLSDLSWHAAVSSPVLGYGTTRDTVGSHQSIAIGHSPECAQCGNRVVGSTGHLWLLLISQGLLGTALYVSFFVRSLWAYRHDHSAIGVAGTLVILMSLFYLGVYSALNMPLLIVLLSVGLLWRNAEHRATASAIARTRVPRAKVRS